MHATPKISEKQHKKQLLMYHDKRFQIDPNFPFIAFSHEQIKMSTSKSFLLAERDSFAAITERILSINGQVLESLTNRMMKEEVVKPQNSEEEKCFRLLNDLDHIQGAIKGSNTSKNGCETRSGL